VRAKTAAVVVNPLIKDCCVVRRHQDGKEKGQEESNQEKGDEEKSNQEKEKEEEKIVPGIDIARGHRCSVQWWPSFLLLANT
jgi:hypothetical protein